MPVGVLEKQMASANFDQLLDRAFPIADQTMLAVTQAPEDQRELLDLLDRAITRGLRNRAQLTEIHVPFERFPFMDSKFWHIPVEDSGDPQVLRLFFESPQRAADRAA
jgi:hypothetical protein